jgi:hypothetical protein
VVAFIEPATTPVNIFLHARCRITPAARWPGS